MNACPGSLWDQLARVKSMQIIYALTPSPAPDIVPSKALHFFKQVTYFITIFLLLNKS